MGPAALRAQTKPLRKRADVGIRPYGCGALGQPVGRHPQMPPPEPSMPGRVPMVQERRPWVRPPYRRRRNPCASGRMWASAPTGAAPRDSP